MPFQKIITEKLDFNLEKNSIEEIKVYLKKAKRREAPGPDEIPLEFYKEMDDEGLQEFVNLLNEWWEGKEEIPEEMLQARNFLLFKKGATKDIENYRPI